MPKRVIDADAMWTSDKLAKCAPESVPEYAWLYAIADANGNFEMTNTAALWGKAYAPIRPGFSIEKLTVVLHDFEQHGLLYVWRENGKRYGHWTGSEKPGRLPAPAHRSKYAGNLVVAKKFLNETEPDPGLAEYLIRTNGHPELTFHGEPLAVSETAPVQQSDVPGSADFAADEQRRVNGWHAFWQAYPLKIHEDLAQKQWYQTVRAYDVDLVLDGLIKWKASPGWSESENYIPYPENFLANRDWASDPKKGNPNGRQFGPAARTTEQHRERARKNAEVFRLNDP